MAASPANTNTTLHINLRSISLPRRSYPTALRIIQEKLNKLFKICEPLRSTASPSKVKTICVPLSDLGDLYRCVGEFLQLPAAQRAFSHHQHEKWVEEALDESVRLIDICGTTRGIILQMKERVRDLQSSLRRPRCGDSSLEVTIIASFICYRKKMNKDILKCLAALNRRNNNKLLGSSPILNLDHHPAALVVQVLGEVGAATVSIFRSLLSLLSAPVLSKPKSGCRWPLLSKMTNKKRLLTREGEHMNDLENVDIALVHCLCDHQQGSSMDARVERMRMAQKSLEALETGLEGVEEGLETTYRRLIQTRVSLLNIFTRLGDLPRAQPPLSASDSILGFRILDDLLIDFIIKTYISVHELKLRCITTLQNNNKN